MTLTGQNFIRIIIIMKLNYVIGDASNVRETSPMDWREVESLAEQYPHVVALLNITKDYMCTGVIINKRTVLTSGSCIDPGLHYIAIGYAVLGKNINSKNLFEIASTVMHGEYIFELKGTDPNVTQMHSNIGLVFSVRPNLNEYLPAADIGNYYASELQKKKLKMVGFGVNNVTSLAVLQHQVYAQAPCTNPKWYYCICGLELSAYSRTYAHEFGQGAPIFLNSDVIGIAAAPCGSLELKSMKVKYNVFTILGPYIAWVNKVHSNFTARFRTTSDARKPRPNDSVLILLAIIKVLFH